MLLIFLGYVASYSYVFASEIQEPVPSVVSELIENKININLADIATLVRIKGIGLAKAKAIIDYRELYGPYYKLQELINVKGINQKLLMKIIPQLRTE